MCNIPSLTIQGNPTESFKEEAIRIINDSKLLSHQKEIAIAAANMGLISGITYNKNGGICVSIKDIEELKEW